MGKRNESDPVIRLEFLWEPERKGWLGRVTYCGVGVRWRRFDHSGSPSIADAVMIFEGAAKEVESWLY